MNKRHFNILWRLISILIIITGLLIPSCGFIGLLFDGDGGDNSKKFYDVQISYNYSGAKLVTKDSPLVMLLIPLNSNMQFNEDGFDNATVVPNNYSPGVATVMSLESGPYAILGYIDDQPSGTGDGQVNMGEVYAFYNMKQFVDSIPQPDYFMVDSGIETWTPHFELNDSYTMDGFVLLAPKQNDTVYGEGIGFIYAVGFQVDPTINTIEILIDAQSQGTFPVDQEVFPVNMSTYSDSIHDLNMLAYNKDIIQISFDKPPSNFPVSFNYVSP